MGCALAATPLAAQNITKNVMNKYKGNVMRLNFLKQIKKTTVLITTMLLIFVVGCKKGIDNPEPQKDYLEYGKVIKKGLIAYYPFDGNANDYSGNKYDGVVNGPSNSIGRFGQQGGALKFNGIDDYIEIPYFSNFNSDSGTVCFWIKTTESINENKKASVISKIDTVGFGYILNVNGFHDFWFDYKIQNLKAAESMQTNYWEDGKYLFLAVTFSTTKLTMYCQRYPTVENTFEIGELRFNNNNQPLFIGKSLISQYEYFEGEIDDLLIYNRALNKDEILELYNWK